MFLHQARVTAAAQVKVAGEQAVDGRRGDEGFGLPGVGWAEQFERGVGGDEFHRRGRIQRALGVVAQERLAGVDALNENADVPGVDAGRLERLGDGGRERFRRLRVRQGGEGNQRRAGEGCEQAAQAGREQSVDAGFHAGQEYVLW